jgi:peptide/nickel transport system permease protein
MAKGKYKKPSRFSSLARTAKLFVKSRIGVLGLAIILFFLVLAVFAPELGTNNPVTGLNVAAPYAIPVWSTVFPEYSHVSVDYYPIPAGSFANGADLSAWQMSGPNFTVEPSQNASSSLLAFLAANASAGPATFLYLNATLQPNGTIAYSYSPNPMLPYGEVLFSMNKSFYFNGNTPPDFQISADVLPLSVVNFSDIYVVYIIQTPAHTTYTLASVEGYDLGEAVEIVNQPPYQWGWVNVTNSLLDEPTNGFSWATGSDVTPTIFNQTGTYTLTLQIQGACSDNPSQYYYTQCGSEPSVSMLISPINLHFIGGAFGLLGSDSMGRDVWSEFVWGSQISLLIGILSAVGSVGLGTFVGITGGYLGGLADEIIGRITDFVLVLPFLPLLIILLFIVTENPAMRSSIYSWVIAIFVVLSWPFIGRLIRSQVLSVKERSYVEASRAVGGGTFHILRRHILPNVMGLVYSQMALSVSGFILTEAALDFLEVAIHPPDVMTWGIMLTQSLGDATTDSIHSYVWWWFLPPGIAIAALSLSFVLVGFALDSVFNPRLRAR